MDTSAYGYGAILCQKDNDDPKTKLHVIAFHSGTFTPIEWNYDIYEREFLAVLKALTKFKLHVLGTEKPVQVLTDHANLIYWKDPRKVN